MTTKEFVQYANDHPELCEKMAVCTSPEEVYAIAVNEGLTDSPDIFRENMLQIKNAMEIGDEELGTVSAAGDTAAYVSAVFLSVSTSAATAAAAATAGAI